jgi:hypothetical protein
MFPHIFPKALAHMRPLLFVSALASCTGSPAARLRGDDAGRCCECEHTRVAGRYDRRRIHAGRHAGYGAAPDESVIAARVPRPFPEQRVVWHATPGVTRGTSRLIAPSSRLPASAPASSHWV